MSKEIDNKIVSMEFDNSKFEKPAEQSISTLDKLKNALHFKNVEQGFDAMNAAIKKVSFDPLAKGIDTVYAKFTFLERFTIQLYDRLSNKIIDMGMQMGRALFVTPRKTGMSEYEEKMSAVQVMVNSTGKDLSYINKKLEELNQYADKTIYSFSDMTNNIGKFTNAGVDLDVAVDAIQGISNVAAVAGATSEQASRAMYNFSQALGMGAVRLQDWMSIENANMATVEFKNALIDMGLQLGTLRKDESGVIKDTKGLTVSVENFRNSLSNGWLSTDVLTKTLSRFSDETDELGKKAFQAATEVKTFSMLIDTLKEALQSGWSQSWEYIIGDFDQAKQLWTDVSNVLGGFIGRMADARNTLLKFWSEMGGRRSLLNAFSNIWKNLTSILGAVRDAFRTVFPPITGRQLVKMTAVFEKLTKKMKPSITTIDRLRHIFVGFFNAVGIVIDAVKALKKSFSAVFKGALGDATGSILKITASFADWVTNLRASIQESKIFERMFTGLAKAIKAVTEIFVKVFKQLITIINAFRTGGVEAGFKAIKTAFVNMVDSIWSYVKSKKPLEAIKKLGTKIADIIEKWPITRGIKNALLKIWDFIKTNPISQFIVGLFEGLVGSVKKAINKFSEISVKPVGNLTDKMREKLKPLEAVKNFFSKIFNGLITVFKKIAPIFKKVGEYLGKVVGTVFKSLGGIINRSDLGDVGQLIMGIGVAKGVSKLKNGTGLFSTLKGVLSSLTDIGKKVSGIIGEVSKTFQSLQHSLDAKALLSIAKAIALLSASLVVLSTIPKDELVKAAAVITELFAALSLSMKSIIRSTAGISGKGTAALASLSTIMVSLGIAVLALSGALAILSLISYENLMKGFLAILLILSAISSFITKVGKEKKTSLAAIPILAMVGLLMSIAVSLSLLTVAAKIDKDALLTAVAAMSIVILAIGALFSIIASSSKWSTALSAFPIATITGLLISISISLFALTMAAKIDAKGLKNAIIGMITVLGAIALFYIFIQKNTGILKAPLSAIPIIAISEMLIAVALSLSLLTLVTRKDPSALAKATIALVATLLAVAAAYVALNKATSNLALLKVTPILAFVAAVVLISGSLSILTLVTRKDPEATNTALKSIVYMLTALTVAYVAISRLTSMKGVLNVIPIIGMAVAIGLLVAPMVVLLKTLKNSSDISNTSAAFDAMNNFSLIIGAFILVFGALKLMASKIKTREIVKATAIVTLMGVLVGGLTVLLERMKKVTVSSITKFALLLTLLTSLVMVASAASSLKAVNTGLNALSKVLIAFSAAVALGAIAVGILVAAMKALSAMSSEDIEKIGKAIDSLATVIMDQKRAIAAAVGGLIATVIETVLSILEQSVAAILEEVFKIIMDVLDFLITKAPQIFDKLMILIGELLDGIKRNASMITGKLVQAFLAIGKGLAKALREHGKEIIEIVTDLLKELSNLIGGFLTRTLGTTDEKVQKLVSTLIRIVLPLVAIIEITSKLVSVIGGFSTITTWLGKIPDLISKIGTGIGRLLAKMPTIVGFVTAHPIIAGLLALAAVATVVASIVMNCTDVMTESDKELYEATEAIREEEEKYQETLKKRQEALRKIDDEAELTEKLIDDLRECVDQNGKVKKGYEARFDYIRKQLNSSKSPLQVEIDSQTKIVQLIDEQNNALDLQSEKITEVIKRNALRSKLESMQSDIEEKRRKVNEEYTLKIAEQRKKLEEFNKQTVSIHGIGDFLTPKKVNDLNTEMANLYRRISSGDETITDDDKARYAKLRAAQSTISEVSFQYTQMEKSVTDMESAMTRAQAEIANYDAAFTALDGSMEDIERASAALDRNLVLSTAGAGLDDVKKEFSKLKEEYETMVKMDVDISDETKEYYQNLFDTVAGDLTSFGEEGQKILDEAGFKNGKTYIEKIREGISDEIKKEDEKEKMLRDLFTEMGYNNIDGIIVGIRERYGSLTKAIEEVGMGSLSAYAHAVGAASPSKKFEQLGIYDVMGLINGVTKKEGALDKAFSAAAASNMAAYTSAMSKNSSSFAFTPMINTSGIQNGTASIQGQLNSLTSLPIGTTLTSQLAASVDTSQIDGDHSSILTAMTSIRDELTSLGDRMSNLEIVMDTGATVGALAPAMDMELGRRTVRKARGV